MTASGLSPSWIATSAIDWEKKTLQRLANVRAESVTYVSGMDKRYLAEEEGFEPPDEFPRQRFSRPPH